MTIDGRNARWSSKNGVHRTYVRQYDELDDFTEEALTDAPPALVFEDETRTDGHI